MNYRASKITRVTLDANRTISSGQTITVFWIVITNSNSSDAEINITDAAGNNSLIVNCMAHDSKVLPIEFVADGGLIIQSIGSTTVSVMVGHSQGGS